MFVVLACLALIGGGVAYFDYQERARAGKVLLMEAVAASIEISDTKLLVTAFESIEKGDLEKAKSILASGIYMDHRSFERVKDNPFVFEYALTNWEKVQQMPAFQRALELTGKQGDQPK